MRTEPCPSPIRILLVEDDEDDYLLTRDCVRAIRPGQMELEWVDREDQALAALASGNHDVCLLDYRLGPVTGLELLQQARQQGWRGPAILLTGQEDDAIDQLAQEAGAADFIEKSQLTPTLLGRSIRYALQHARTLEVLRRSQESFRSLIERLPDGLAVQDGERLVYVNPALVSLLGGARAEDIVGKTVPALAKKFLSAAEWAVLERDLAAALHADGPVSPREVRIPNGKGGHSTVSLSRAPLVFDGRPCMLWSARDLTESRQMQERLLQADRMAALGVLSAGIAHEINNPLAYTLSNLEHLEKMMLPQLELPAGPRDEMHALVSDARMGATRVRDIVRQLKIFSRVDQDARPQPVDVHHMLETSISMAMNELKHRARLVRDYHGESLLAEGEEGRLGQVFLNLIVNAAHAIPEGSVERQEIRIVTRPHATGVRIEVRDTGMGIPSEHLERIFEPFFTTKPVGVGTGLGLSICHGIVTGFGGHMGVESQVGKGSTFWVTLKAATAPRPAASVRASGEAKTQRRPAAHRGRILVVDDEPMIGLAIRRTLQREHEVVTLTSAREACARLKGGERFDLVLSDLMMPEMSGVELHQELSRLSPELAARMVFLTGGAFTPYARSFLSEVQNHRLEKPFSAEELRGLVQSLLMAQAS